MEGLRIKTDYDEQVIRVWYQPKTDRSLYDVCDMNGRVLKSGEMETEGARIDISDLDSAEYMLLVLDGEELLRSRIELKNGSENG